MRREEDIMSIPVTFEKRRAQDLLARLLAGRPLVASGESWDHDALL